MGDIDTLRLWIEEAKPKSMVFFGGAGVSVESGIPDFRSPDGLYSLKYSVPPEQMISRTYFDAHPEQFFEFYFDRMIASDVQPNRAHRKLAELEREGTLAAVITQNIDGLHQAAGSTCVHELHGSVHRNYCLGCGRAYNLDEMIALHEASADGVPRCSECGKVVKPDVVLYEEPLDNEVISASLEAIQKADLLLIAGTSLVVWPAAGFVDYFRGEHLAIVNLSATPRDRNADLCIQASIGDVLDY